MTERPATPAELERTLGDIIASCQRIRSEYKWVAGLAYGQNVGESSGKVSNSAKPDPTGSVATSPQKAAMRSRASQATERTKDALGLLRGAEQALKRATAYEPERVAFVALRFPRTATRADLKDSREARIRRAERQEEIPE